MTVSIVGTGYVGLTTGALLAAAGHKVYCIDIDTSKIEKIKKGKSYFYEPGLNFFIKEGIKSGRLIPTLSYKESIPRSDIAMICVGTPAKGDGSVDLTYIYQAAESIAEYMKKGLIVVQKSTVPVGTGRKLERILKNGSKRSTFHVVSCPEFLAEGSAVFDSFNMDRLVVGGDNQGAKKKVIALFRSLDKYAKEVDFKKLKKFAGTYKKKVKLHYEIPFSERTVSVSLESAELIKVTANAFLTTKISFANSIARVCDEVGADVSEVMEGVGLDERVGRAFLYAGLGWGGGCFPKDTAGLIYSAEEVGFDFKMLKAVVDINNSQVLYIIRKAKNMLRGKIEGKVISVLGLTFKPGTSDVRISPAIKLVNNLARRGAKVRVYDPKGMREAKTEVLENVYFAEDIKDVLKGSHLAILATEWPEFINIDFKKHKKLFKAKNLLDARNRWDREKAKGDGFNYQGIGR